jgi:hypothetical protein
MIEVRPGHSWSAAGWLFNWTLRVIAVETQDIEVAARLTGIVGENLGFLRLSDLGDSYALVSSIITSRLMAVADEQLPTDMPGREAALAHLRMLVEEIAESTP